MRNHEVTQRHLLLNEHGRLKEAGWSRSLLQEYRREDIKAKTLENQGMGLLSDT
ncbi:hypothetical protein [[Clostridium] innocuum]|uniref:DUF2804 family protein n=1 Tax=Clostridium TaxID=1485 RepID=UPI0035632C11